MACELLSVALRHAESRHNGIGPAIYGGLDHGPRVLEPLDGPGARVVHRYDQRPAVGSQYRYVPHLPPRIACTVRDTLSVQAISIL